MVKIDFSKAGHYKSKQWLAMEKKLADNMGKVTYWRSAQGGDPYTVKKGFLYDGKERIYFDKFGKEIVYYKKKKGYYDRHYTNIMDELKKEMVKFRIQKIRRKK